MSTGEDEPLVWAEDLVLAYGAHVAVAASSFSVPGQSVVAIIGPNGSGKSTLLHAIAGLIRPASGTLEVLGSPAAEARSRLSYVLQHTDVPRGTPITVREAVGMGRYPSVGVWRRRSAEDRRRVREAMAELDVTALRSRHLDKLSGGQRQRVSVAQGIAQDHEVLLLDEPLTGLDLVSARTIDRIIHRERDLGRSVVLTTHDLDEAHVADHVILMSRVVVASGPPHEVLQRHHLETAYGLGALHPADSEFLDDPADHHHDPS
jgi:manganese transport system ATP-binding protein